MLSFNFKKIFKSFLFIILLVLGLAYGYISFSTIYQEELKTKTDYPLLAWVNRDLEQDYISFGNIGFWSGREDAQVYKDFYDLLFDTYNTGVSLELDYINYDRVGEEAFNEKLRTYLDKYERAEDFYKTYNFEERSATFSSYDGQPSYGQIFTERAKTKIKNEGSYKPTSQVTGLEGLAYLSFDLDDLSFLIVLFVAMALLVEASYQDHGLDEVSHKKASLYLYRLATVVLLTLILLIAISLGPLIFSLTRGYGLGSIKTPIIKDITGYESFILTSLKDSYLILFLSLTLALALLYSLYEILRRFLTRLPAMALVLAGLLGLSGLLDKFRYTSIEGFTRGFFFEIVPANIIRYERGLLGLALATIAMVLCLSLVNRKKHSLKQGDANREFKSPSPMGLALFEFTKLRRSKLVKVSFIVLLLAMVLTGQRLEDRKDTDPEYSLAMMDLDIEAAYESFESTTGIDARQGLDEIEDGYFKRELEARLSLMDRFRKAYQDRYQNPSSYYKVLRDYIQGELVGRNAANNIELNMAVLNRIDYMEKKKIMPDSQINLVSGSWESNLFDSSNLVDHYISKFKSPLEEKSGPALLVSSLESFSFQGLVIILAFLLASSFIRELEGGSINFLYLSPNGRFKSFMTKYLVSLGILALFIILSALLIFLLGYRDGAMGQTSYPLFSYEEISRGNFRAFYQPIVGAIGPSLLMCLLLGGLIMAMTMFLGLLIKKWNLGLVTSIASYLLGAALARSGLLSSLALVNPFIGFDPLLAYNGGIGYFNGHTMSYTSIVLTMLVYTIIFIGLSIWKIRGGRNVRNK